MIKFFAQTNHLQLHVGLHIFLHRNRKSLIVHTLLHARPLCFQQKKFDGVPFGPNDFGSRCYTSSGKIENYNDADQVRNCNLLDLMDLDLGSDYVQKKIAGYFDDMLGIGIDG